MYEVLPTTIGHMVDLAENMRGANVDEVWASHRHRPGMAVYGAVTQSEASQTWLSDGQVLCIFGVHRLSELSSVGSPWLLSSEAVLKHTREFFRTSKREFMSMTQDYSFLYNYADARDAYALHWLKWLGFEIEDAEPFGWMGLPFHRFRMEIS